MSHLTRRSWQESTGRRLGVAAVVALAILVLPLSSHAQTSSSESFMLTLSPTGGVVESSSESFRLTAFIVGDGVAGEASSASFRAEIGGVTFITTAADDDDADSVSNGDEAAVRGGDGNGDSIPDQLQAAVASLPGFTTPVTAEIRAGGCASVSLAASASASSLGPGSRFGFPHDLVRLRLRCEGDGAEAVIRLLLHTAAEPLWPPDDVRAFGVRAPDFEGVASFFSLPVEGTGIVMLDETPTPYIDLRLIDGMFGDMESESAVIEVTFGPAWPLRPVRR